MYEEFVLKCNRPIKCVILRGKGGIHMLYIIIHVIQARLAMVIEKGPTQTLTSKINKKYDFLPNLG